MFTGIVAAAGSIFASTPSNQGARVGIAAGGLDLADVAIGDSIAVNGCCLTVVERDTDTFVVDVSRETLECTIGFAVGSSVNLEKSLRLSDRLGGHLVSGHVDGVGEVSRFRAVGDSWLLEVCAPESLAKYLARKGAITVNGVSLTVNAVSGAGFQVNLIPHTLAATNLQQLAAGSRVNLEVDMVARYVERLLVAAAELPAAGK